MKPAKKNPYQLKFDTSKNNIECFIKKKSTSMNKRKTSRTKIKSTFKKPQFQQAKFISDIVKNAIGEEYQDTQQVNDMLNKINIYGQDKNQSPTGADDLLKTFDIFKQQGKKLTHQIPQMTYRSYSKSFNSEKEQKINQKDQTLLQKKQRSHKKQQEISLGKEYQWNNFSTQMGTDIDTERSKKQQIKQIKQFNQNISASKQQYPSILSNQHIVQSPIQININTKMSLNPQYPSMLQLPLTQYQSYDQSALQYMQLQYSNAFLSSFSKQNPHRRSTPIRGQNQQFKIKVDHIQNDQRTTIMIRHIPNKYTQQMLIDEINVNHKNKYNFFYLPMDSYNPCNVGYAFINFIDTKFIKKFYLEFNNKKWVKFNSIKVCQLAYGRIQGSTALINHFQNSNVMQSKNKNIRPFISFGDSHGNGR